MITVKIDKEYYHTPSKNIEELIENQDERALLRDDLINLAYDTTKDDGESFFYYVNGAWAKESDVIYFIN